MVYQVSLFSRFLLLLNMPQTRQSDVVSTRLFFGIGKHQKSPSVVPINIEPTEAPEDFTAEIDEGFEPEAIDSPEDLGSEDITEIEIVDSLDFVDDYEYMPWDPLAEEAELSEVLEEATADLDKPVASDEDDFGEDIEKDITEEAKVTNLEEAEIISEVSAANSEEVVGADGSDGADGLDGETVAKSEIEVDEAIDPLTESEETAPLANDESEEETEIEDVASTDEEDNDESEEEETDEEVLVDTPVFLSDVTNGIGVVTDPSGKLSVIWKFDGGAYEGQVGVVSTKGMENYDLNSIEFMQEAIRRALANIVVDDTLNGAEFGGWMNGEDSNHGEFTGVQTVQLSAGEQFFLALIPNDTFADVLTGLESGEIPTGSTRPLFSLATANPEKTNHFVQLVDLTGKGNIFALEDIRGDEKSDWDLNDIIITIKGAEVDAASLDYLIERGEISEVPKWMEGELGKAILESAIDDLSIESENLVSEKYDFPKEDQPLIGFIDTHFTANNPDLDSNRITFGGDYIENDSNPTVTVGEGTHGDHVLGIVGATQDNGIGIDGINDDAPLWVSSAVGSGKWEEALTSFVKAVKASGQPTGVINLSIDLTQVNSDGSITTRYEFTPAERAALELARQNDILIVVSIGNENGVPSVLGQASQEFHNIITVGSAQEVILPDGTVSYARADYSNYGDTLDIVAPGGTAANPVVSTVGDGVGKMAGTSVATAKVTGAASLIRAANPELNAMQVIEILKKSATDINTLDWDAETGAGLLNIAAAVSLGRITQGEEYKPLQKDIPLIWGETGKPLERPVANPSIDLVANSLEIIQNSLKKGEPFDVKFKIDNKETGIAKKVEVEFRLVDAQGKQYYIGTHTIDSLASGSQEIITKIDMPPINDIAWQILKGNIQLMMVIDPVNRIVETNEGNNILLTNPISIIDNTPSGKTIKVTNNSFNERPNSISGINNDGSLVQYNSDAGTFIYNSLTDKKELFSTSQFSSDGNTYLRLENESLFVYDRIANTRTLVAQKPSDKKYLFSSMSENGKHIIYYSYQNANGTTDYSRPNVYIYDVVAGTTTIDNKLSDFVYSHDWNWYTLSMSDDGSKATFTSNEVINGKRSPQVFFYDKNTGVIKQLTSSGTNDNNQNTVISADGKFIAFTSGDMTLVSNDINQARDAFVYETATGNFKKVSVGINNAEANGNSYVADISADSRYILFISDATNLVVSNTLINKRNNIFVYDTLTGKNTLVNIDENDQQTYSQIYLNGSAKISGDGKQVAFMTDAIDAATGQFGSTLFVRAWQPQDTVTVGSVDLAGQSFDIPNGAIAGDTINAQFQLSNNGNTATKPFRAGFYISQDGNISTADKFLGFRTIDSVPANGNTSSLNIPLTLPPANDPFWNGTGKYYVGMIADDTGTIIETNEANNANQGINIDFKELNITVPVAGDLVNNGISLTKSAMNAGEEFRIFLGVANNTANSMNNFRVGFYISKSPNITKNDKLLGTQDVATLAGNANLTVRADLKLPSYADSFWDGSGTYYIGAIVDDQDKINESNEMNNVMATPFTYKGLVDLAGSYFNIADSNKVIGNLQYFDAGDTIETHFQVNNNGSGQTTPVKVSFYISEEDKYRPTDTIIGSYIINSLAGNSNSGLITQNFQLPTNLAAYGLKQQGSYKIGMIIDSDNTVQEINEFNNVNLGVGIDSKDIMIRTANLRLPELTGNILSAPTSLKPGDNFNLQYSVSNNGVVNAGSSQPIFYLVDQNNSQNSFQLKGLSQISPVGSLASNSSSGVQNIQLTLPDIGAAFWQGGSGNYAIQMEVDTLDQVAEFNEHNNETNYPVQINYIPIFGAFLDKWRQNPSLGLPTAVVKDTGNGTKTQYFANGFIYSDNTGVYVYKTGGAGQGNAKPVDPAYQEKIVSGVTTGISNSGRWIYNGYLGNATQDNLTFKVDKTTNIEFSIDNRNANLSLFRGKASNGAFVSTVARRTDGTYYGSATLEPGDYTLSAWTQNTSTDYKIVTNFNNQPTSVETGRRTISIRKDQGNGNPIIPGVRLKTHYLIPSSGNLNFYRGQQWVTSSDYKFVFQNDGNLVLINPQGIPIWATGTDDGTNPVGADRFSVQADGNVVLYAGNKAVWATSTEGNPGAYLAIQGDGNLVVRSANGNPLFASGTDNGNTRTLTASQDWLKQLANGSARNIGSLKTKYENLNYVGNSSKERVYTFTVDQAMNANFSLNNLNTNSLDSMFNANLRLVDAATGNDVNLVNPRKDSSINYAEADLKPGINYKLIVTPSGSGTNYKLAIDPVIPAPPTGGNGTTTKEMEDFFTSIKGKIGIKRLDAAALGNDFSGECVTLIATYLQEVFFPADQRTKALYLNNGGSTAASVAQQFPQYFEPLTNNGLPQRGAVISFPSLSAPAGHVAIVMDSQQLSTGQRQVRIMDSNRDSKRANSRVTEYSEWINVPSDSIYGSNIVWTNPKNTSSVIPVNPSATVGSGLNAINKAIFQTAYDAAGMKAQGVVPYGDATRTLAGNGWKQEFRQGNERFLLMMQDGASQAFWVQGDNLKEYEAVGGTTALGYPISNAEYIHRKGGDSNFFYIKQRFSANGGTAAIHNLLGIGSVATWGNIGAKYYSLSSADSWLGMPIKREVTIGNMIYADFEYGQIVHNKTTGVTEVLKKSGQKLFPSTSGYVILSDKIASYYESIGGANSWLGLPTKPSWIEGKNNWATFEKGLIVSYPNGKTEAFDYGDYQLLGIQQFTYGDQELNDIYQNLKKLKEGNLNIIEIPHTDFLDKKFVRKPGITNDKFSYRDYLAQKIKFRYEFDSYLSASRLATEKDEYRNYLNNLPSNSAQELAKRIQEIKEDEEAKSKANLEARKSNPLIDFLEGFATGIFDKSWAAAGFGTSIGMAAIRAVVLSKTNGKLSISQFNESLGIGEGIVNNVADFKESIELVIELNKSISEFYGELQKGDFQKCKELAIQIASLLIPKSKVLNVHSEAGKLIAAIKDIKDLEKTINDLNNQNILDDSDNYFLSLATVTQSLNLIFSCVNIVVALSKSLENYVPSKSLDQVKEMFKIGEDIKDAVSIALNSTEHDQLRLAYDQLSSWSEQTRIKGSGLLSAIDDSAKEVGKYISR